MNGPSRNALRNLIDLYRWIPVQDADGGAPGDDASYGLMAAAVPCGIHLVSSTEQYDAQNRPTTVNTYKVSFRTDQSLRLRDRGIFRLDGVTRTAFLEGYIDRSGRSAAYEAVMTERASGDSGDTGSLIAALLLEDGTTGRAPGYGDTGSLIAALLQEDGNILALG